MNRLATIPFDWRGVGALTEMLRLPLRGLFASRAAHGMPYQVLLANSTSSAVRLSSKMHDIGSRKEIGVLSLDEIPFDASTRRGEPLPESFKEGPLAPWKLTIEENGIVAESGLVLSSLRDELIVVAGAYPFTLAVIIDGRHIDDAQPEYPLAQYKRSRI